MTDEPRYTIITAVAANSLLLLAITVLLACTSVRYAVATQLPIDKPREWTYVIRPLVAS